MQRYLCTKYILSILMFIVCKTSASNSSSNSEEVLFLSSYIEEANARSVLYKLPTSAKEYQPNDTETTDFGTYDFIIVGAGPAGAIIANRLSEINQWNILLIEAGGFGNNDTQIPYMYSQVDFTDYNWGFKSVPQKTACLGMVNSTCSMPRGKGIGGCTLINGVIYSRGSSIDFDRWAKTVNDSRWSYKQVLPYFQKTENLTHRDPSAPVTESAHGTEGLWNIEYHLPRSPQLNVFLKANEELGYNQSDYNAGTGLGVSPTQITTKNGRRCDVGSAFVVPFLQRGNLKVIDNSYVTKILIDNDKNASGVLFAHDKKYYTVNAKKEVIISAGVFQSAQLLMLSGIGPKKHLEALNISVINDLQVGSKLRDHPAYYGINFNTNYTEPILPLEEYVEQYISGIGPLTIAGSNQGVGFYESQYTNGTGYPDLELIMVPANATSNFTQRAFLLTNQTYEDIWRNSSRAQAFSIHIVTLHSASTGTLRLRNSDPFEYPLIDNKFLSDPKGKDINVLYEGVQLSLKLADTEAMKKINATLLGHPLKPCSHLRFPSRKYWNCAIRQVSFNMYHPVGTCPMGTDPLKGAVVDSETKVFGIRKLRVADASVFPFTLAGHPTAAAVMLGEKISDFIKENYI